MELDKFFWLREMISDQFIINNVDVSNVKEVILDVHVKEVIIPQLKAIHLTNQAKYCCLVCSQFDPS